MPTASLRTITSPAPGWGGSGTSTTRIAPTDCVTAARTCTRLRSWNVDLDADPLGILEEQLPQADAGDLVVDRLDALALEPRRGHGVVGVDERDVVDEVRSAVAGGQGEPHARRLLAVDRAIGDVDARVGAGVHPVAGKRERGPLARLEPERALGGVARAVDVVGEHE